MKKKTLATDINVGNKAAGHGSNVPMQPNIPPMPSNTSNALDALADAYKGRSNALGMSKCDNKFCKYNDEGCIFFAQGSGNPEDMPCAEALITKKRVLKLLEERFDIFPFTADIMDAIECMDADAVIDPNGISRQQAIREMREICNPSIARFVRAKLALEALQPVAIRLESKNTVDIPETEGSDPSQIAAQIIHDAIDNTTFAEDAYPGIKEQLHRSVEEWEKLQPVFAEIAEEYKKACEISYINKPLAYALHEVWKKHDRRDTNRNE